MERIKRRTSSVTFSFVCWAFTTKILSQHFGVKGEGEGEEGGGDGKKEGEGGEGEEVKWDQSHKSHKEIEDR